MTHATNNHSPSRLEIVSWAARLGSVTADALATRAGISSASARARLLAAERGGLLRGVRPLAGEPPLYTVTRAGLRACGEVGLDPASVSAASARHAIVCASVAAWLEHSYPRHHLMGERELRREERAPDALRAVGARLARRAGGARTHRPDLVLWPESHDGALPVAVEVELTVKGLDRLTAICRAWSRTRTVAGAVYLVTPQVRRPLERAIERSRAAGRISVIALERVVPAAVAVPVAPASERTIATGA